MGTSILKHVPYGVNTELGAATNDAVFGGVKGFRKQCLGMLAARGPVAGPRRGRTMISCTDFVVHEGNSGDLLSTLALVHHCELTACCRLAYWLQGLCASLLPQLTIIKFLADHRILSTLELN